MRRRSLETFGRALPLASLKSSAPLKSFALYAAALACLCFGFKSAAAQRPSTAAAQQPSPSTQAEQTTQTAAQKYFTDVVLLNQDGEKMRLYSDLLKDKVVVIDFFFATCQGSCLPLNRNLQKLQEALGDHVGKDVHFISVSVDPTTDTPARLKEYAKKLEARRGWYFLTGDKANVDFALRKLG